MHPPALYYYYNSARHNMCIRAALNQPASCTLHNAQCTMHHNTPISMHNIHVQTINNCPCWQQRTNSKRLPVAPVMGHEPTCLSVSVYFSVYLSVSSSLPFLLPFFLSLSSLFSLISRFLSFSLSRSFFLCFFLYLSSSLLAHPGSLDLWIYQQARCVRHETMRHCFHLRSSCTLCAKDDEPCLKAARSHAISAEPSLNSLHCRPCASSTQSLTSVFWEKLPLEDNLDWLFRRPWRNKLKEIGGSTAAITASGA